MFMLASTDVIVTFYLVLLQYYGISQQAVSSFEYANNNLESEYAPTLTMKIIYRNPSRCFSKPLDAFPCMIVLHI